MEGLDSARGGRHRLHSDADGVVDGLLRGEGRAAREGEYLEALRLFVGDVVALLHDARVEAARRAVLRDFLKEVELRAEEEVAVRGRGHDVDAALHRRVVVLDHVGEREGELHRRGSAGLADVVAGDRYRRPVRQVLAAVFEHVDGELDAGRRREDVGAAAHVFFKDVVLEEEAYRVRVYVVLLREGDVEGEHDDGVRVRRRAYLAHLLEGYALEERFDVGEGVYRDADLSDFAFGHRVVGVVAHLSRQVERDGEARAALLYDVTEASVGFFSGGEARVLPHRPELAVAVHVLADAARERIVARFAELGLEVLALYVFFGVYALQLVARQRRMFSFFRH